MIPGSAQEIASIWLFFNSFENSFLIIFSIISRYFDFDFGVSNSKDFKTFPSFENPANKVFVPPVSIAIIIILFYDERVKNSTFEKI